MVEPGSVVGESRRRNNGESPTSGGASLLLGTLQFSVVRDDTGLGRHRKEERVIFVSGNDTRYSGVSNRVVTGYLYITFDVYSQCIH